MAIKYNTEPVITKGLVLAIDYANLRCIEQNDTVETCKNLVNPNGPGGGAVGGSAGRFMTWKNDPDVGPVMNADGSDGIHFDEQLGVGNSGVTYQFWVYKISNQTNYLFDARGGDYSGGGGGGVYCFSNYQNININVDGSLTYNFSSTYNASDPKFLNKWLNIAITGKTSENGLIYINGEEVSVNTQGLETSYVAQTPIDTDIGDDFRIGHRYNMSFTNPFKGYMGPFLIYTRKLTDAEIINNFSVHKKRFGL